MEVSDYYSQWFLNFVVQHSLIEQRILTGTHHGALVKRGPARGGDPTKILCLCRNLRKGDSGALQRNHYSSALIFCVSNTYKLPLIYNKKHNLQEGPLKLTDKRCSLKCKENLQKLLLLGIQTSDKLAKPPFFVAYSRLCHHSHDLAEGDSLLARFHLSLLFGSWQLSELTLAGPLKRGHQNKTYLP